jgi:hypothetical protein
LRPLDIPLSTFDRRVECGLEASTDEQKAVAIRHE